eukprot:227762-Chlamydomonas_euryale.AAC.2
MPCLHAAALNSCQLLPPLAVALPLPLRRPCHSAASADPPPRPLHRAVAGAACAACAGHPWARPARAVDGWRRHARPRHGAHAAAPGGAARPPAARCV